ncbi:hypothetical protein BU16DRAFT_349988 [Lophium mytilinum]|uniref:Uncharacterized protein n=1 Tax=Lophium mytilinum TaxID=390894 RepID=A0A6A6QXD4_9PEZI|nr:hypothetical protein BU16DRAFT_349988 [Lophium mytilinum]
MAPFSASPVTQRPDLIEDLVNMMSRLTVSRALRKIEVTTTPPTGVASNTNPNSGPTPSQELPASIKNSPLFRLPRELRDEIYGYVFYKPKGLRFDERTRRLRGMRDWEKEESLDLAINYTCKAIHEETLDLSLKVNEIHFGASPNSRGIISSATRFNMFLERLTLEQRRLLRNVSLIEHLDNDYIPDLDFILQASQRASLFCQELPLLHITFVMYFGISFYPVSNNDPFEDVVQKQSYRGFEKMSQWMLELKHGKDTGKKFSFSIQVPDLFDQESISRCLKEGTVWPVNFFWFLANQATIDEINGAPWAPDYNANTKYLVRWIRKKPLPVKQETGDEIGFYLPNDHDSESSDEESDNESESSEEDAENHQNEYTILDRYDYDEFIREEAEARKALGEDDDAGIDDESGEFDSDEENHDNEYDDDEYDEILPPLYNPFSPFNWRLYFKTPFWPVENDPFKPMTEDTSSNAPGNNANWTPTSHKPPVSSSNSWSLLSPKAPTYGTNDDSSEL